MGMITVTEYAARQGLSPVSVRQKAARGGYETARKSGKIWLIDEGEENTDGRIKSGKYIGARGRAKRNRKAAE